MWFTINTGEVEGEEGVGEHENYPLLLITPDLIKGRGQRGLGGVMKNATGAEQKL